MDQTPKARCLTSLDANQVIATVAAYFKATPSTYQSKRSTAPGRDLAAYLAHRRTTATLRELATAFGLSHPDSVSNLIRRAETAISASKSQKQDLDQIEELLPKPQTGSDPTNLCLPKMFRNSFSLKSNASKGPVPFRAGRGFLLDWRQCEQLICCVGGAGPSRLKRHTMSQVLNPIIKLLLPSLLNGFEKQ